MSMPAYRDLGTFYRRWLLEAIVPFWIEHAPDNRHGGYVTCLAADGSPYDTDKVCMWAQGRIAWTFARLYNDLAQEPGWLAFAQSGVDFIRTHGFAPDGRMYYALTQDGRPLRTSQDIYTELSTVLAFSEVARATGDDELYCRAHDLFLSVWRRFQTPGNAYQPWLPQTRPVRLHGHCMISLNVLQELRRCRPLPAYDEMIRECIALLLGQHLHASERAVFEVVGWDGTRAPGALGRWINPGHMIEGGSFLIHEGRYQSNNEWVTAGVKLIDWGFQWGWDREFGGIFNDVDCDGLPIPEGTAMVADGKLWWQHAEALYGLLLAHHVTDESRFLDAYRLTHEYSFARFAAGDSGEWIACLDRRGNPVVNAVGTARKNTFHSGRNALLAAQLLGAVPGGPMSPLPSR
jgi:N-acylglucosamine 2-epimerase